VSGAARQPLYGGVVAVTPERPSRRRRAIASILGQVPVFGDDCCGGEAVISTDACSAVAVDELEQSSRPVGSRADSWRCGSHGGRTRKPAVLGKPRLA